MGLWAKLTGKPDTPAKTTISGHTQKKNKYRGVRVVAKGINPCGAVRAIAEKRFLSSEAPILPLPDCDSDECRCVYKRFDDRRVDARRMMDFGYSTASQFVVDEQRSPTSSGRRKDD